MSTTTGTSPGRTVGLCLEPLDVLLFRDGRPFGASTRVTSGLPLPQTVAGAVWTALLQQAGCNFNELGRLVRSGKSFGEAVSKVCGAGWITSVQVRGPWLARSTNHTLEVLVPAPAALHQAKKQKSGPVALHRLDPLKHDVALPGWKPLEEGMRPLWFQKQTATEPAAVFLTLEGLRAFLAGDLPDASQVVGRDDLFTLDHRTGIGIEPDRLAAQESEIYGASFLALRSAYTAEPDFTPDRRPQLPEVVLYAEVVLPDASVPPNPFAGMTVLALGGEAKRAGIRTVNPVEWPGKVPKDKQKPLLVLTTPGLFAAGWKPSCLDGPGRLVAAAVPGYTAVSGWDLARGGPKPTRFAAAAGSVYFLHGQPAGALPVALSDREEDCLQGWGCFVQGVWTDG
jgi:CRISPR-associated protein Cmr3